MNYFSLKPDYQILSKYTSFNLPPDEMKKHHPEFALVIDWYWEEEQILKIENSFLAICERYNIREHYDNLMLLTLSGFRYLETVLYEMQSRNAYRTRLKELASVLLTFVDSSNEINLRSSAGSFKVRDKAVMEFIYEGIEKMITKGEFKIGTWGMEPSLLIQKDPETGQKSIDKDKLQEVAEIKLEDVAKEERVLWANLCLFTILPYLNTETRLVKANGTNFSDAQLNFLYDTLILHNLLGDRIFDKKMDYEAKDFMRNILIKHAKSLIKKGNQSP